MEIDEIPHDPGLQQKHGQKTVDPETERTQQNSTTEEIATTLSGSISTDIVYPKVNTLKRSLSLYLSDSVLTSTAAFKNL